ncbi:MAG: PDZ domain-containing protein [Planctomycetota bacterium]
MKRMSLFHSMTFAIAAIAVSVTQASGSNDFREALRIAEPSLGTVTVSAKASIQNEAPDEADADGKQGPRIEILRDNARAQVQGRFFDVAASQPSTSAAFAVGPSTVIAYTGRPVDEVSVELAGGESVDGKVRVYDYVTGLSAIELEGQNLESLIISAASPEPGLPVVATWLQDGRLTSDAGMIASRALASSEGLGLAPAIDFGGSTPSTGSPLIDGNGIVVGALIPSERGIHCVPAAALQRLVNEMDAEDRVDLKRGLVGIQFEGGGPLVLEVQDDSGASEAGIQAGDLVTQVDEFDVRSSRDVVSAIASFRAGEKVQVIVERDGKSETVDVTLQEHPQQQLIAGLRANQVPGFQMQQAFELKDGKLVPMQIDPDQLLVDPFPEMREFMRGFNAPMFRRGQIEGLQIERGNIEEMLKELQDQMNQLNEKLDR